MVVPQITPKQQFLEIAQELSVPRTQLEYILNNLYQLGEYHPPLVEHSVNVGLISVDIAKYIGLKPRHALTGGVNHDVGKLYVKLSTLRKTDSREYGRWTEADGLEMQKHPIRGYEHLANDGYLFDGLCALLHHADQNGNSYPTAEEMPQLPTIVNPQTLSFIRRTYAKIVELADKYFALGRDNDRIVKDWRGNVDKRNEMHRFNPDDYQLIEDLYNNRVLKD